MSTTLDITTPSDREIAMSRTFSATRDQVFKALTTPTLVKRWLLGPPDWTMPVCEIDLRVGGKYRYVWRNDDGREMGVRGEYLEITPGERIVATEVFDDPWYEGSAVITSTLTERGDETTLTMTARYDSKAVRDHVLASPMEDGVGASYDRLASLLDSVDRAFIISRLFDAPRDLVWKAWTDESLLAKWFGPPNTTIAHCTVDLREGGLVHYCMRSNTDPADEHWGRWLLREIVPPERLVCIVSFADRNANPIRAPFDENWPVETLSTFTFTEEAGKTRVTIHWEPINATDAERDAFNKGLEGMESGWSGTLDALEAFLRS
jgi:uncharacterized protein YndB with AHSA1/START domain